ncbi:MAG: PEP-CTERM sorting domain-containing protein [Burkholderiaceae bacterium]|nr:MAG: PEP-CTERM sorting domain-containing protein [Burkholderiaceae bacterium]
MKKYLISLLLSLACGISTAWAGATLHIGSGYGTPCATGGCPLYAGEVNPFSSTLDIYQNSGGAAAALDPVLLIFGVPNDSSAAGSHLLNSSAVTSASLIHGGVSSAIGFSFGTFSYGLGGSGFKGLMGSGQEVYDDLLHLTGANASNNFANWREWDADLYGITANNFGIYVFALDTSSFGKHDYLQIGLSGIPEGTFAIAFGEDAPDKHGNYNVFSTPFTESGLNGGHHSVPAPTSWMLILLGLVVLMWSRRRFTA